MSTLLMDERIFTSKYVPKHNCSRVLKSRENIGKLKCNKSLKKKLKKYKLRKDGQEDPDIIDVSQTLINSLRIKSPNNNNLHSQKLCEEDKPHNYLTKMVRLKKSGTMLERKSMNAERFHSENKDDSICLSPDVQDKKQTDAFKLLMDSRNKSIGSNSPGKEKCEENSQMLEGAEKKELKAKRILSLNRMAHAKGSLKKLEIEEYREENIKRKMEARAQKLKHMVVGLGAQNEKKDKINHEKLEKKSESPVTSDIIKNTNKLDIKTQNIKSFDLFKNVQLTNNSNVKKISEEDEEFLKKLSPSIRKKENMLCYFQKVNKDSEILQDDVDTESQNRDQVVIKVELKPRNRVAHKRTKHIAIEETKLTEYHKYDTGMINDGLQPNICDSNQNSKKRKLNEKNETAQKESVNINLNATMPCHNDNRPKRNTKKPVKYTEDFQLISSDEEFNIFTPTKKRKDKSANEGNFKPIIHNNKEQVKVDKYELIGKDMKIKQKGKHILRKPMKSEVHKIVVPKKATKLAPIFATKLDSAAIEAKQKFLKSGVPSQLKKASTHQTYMFANDEFQKVVHIQQHTRVNTPIVTKYFSVFDTNSNEDFDVKEEKNVFRKLLPVPILENYPWYNYSVPKFQKNVNQILQDIKKSYPKFPVYRTFHLLMGKSKGEFNDCVYPELDNSVEIFNNIVDMNNIHPDKLNWADKYKPTTEKQVIGNFESLKELRRWLVTWTENDAKSKKNQSGSDSSDFYQSDTDSRETTKNINNLLIITGNVGTGKTQSVYAVAAELAMKVIEVNASTKRTGKIMLQDLQEATQSHKVDRSKNRTENSQKSREENLNIKSNTVVKKRGRKKKAEVETVTKASITKKESTELTVNQDNIRTGMSLILIDDADVVFDQDDGFCFAISQLIQSSKRPVILVTSSLTCPHLQKFSCLAKIIKMRPFLPRMLGTWLDIMCLVDNNMCSPGLGAKTLDLFKGDIRKTINHLQFFITSYKHLGDIDDPGLVNKFQEQEMLKVIVDENSCTSWGESEGWGAKNIESNSNDSCNYVFNKESQYLHFMNPLNNFHFWWNLPNLLNYSIKQHHENNKHTERNITQENKEMNKIAIVYDNVSLTNYLGNINGEYNIISGPWQSFERDSVIDNENFASYNRNKESINEISWELMLKGLVIAQNVIGSENKTEMNYPSMSVQRERDRVVARHKTLTNCLNPSTALDRRALALDYWSSCRNICRTEKSKTNSSSKRNNRFCHYLKSLNIVCKNEYFDNLGDSLCFKK